MKKKVLIGSAFVVLVGGLAAVGSVAQHNNLPYVAETSLPTVESSASFGKLYHNEKEMFQDADVVALVKVQGQEVVNHTESLVTTKSNVSVEQLFKGDSATSLTISELGGPVDFSKIPDIGKPSDGKPKQTGVVETTIEGSPVMKMDHTYFVFLKKNPDPQWGYNILGSVQGKVRFDTDKNIGVTTVDTEHFKEDLFFLQKELAGKGKHELIQHFNSLS